MTLSTVLTLLMSVTDSMTSHDVEQLYNHEKISMFTIENSVLQVKRLKSYYALILYLYIKSKSKLHSDVKFYTNHSLENDLEVSNNASV